MEDPKLLVTVKNNKHNRCIIEILNRLYLKDINANAFEVINNVILVFTTLSPDISYGLLISGPPSCVAKAFPIHLVIRSTREDEIIKNVVDFVKSRYHELRTFYVDCYSRGIEVDCREIEIGIGLGLRGIMKTDFKNPERVITINVVKDSSYLSLIRKGQEKVSVNPLR